MLRQLHFKTRFAGHIGTHLKTAVTRNAMTPCTYTDFSKNKHSRNKSRRACSLLTKSNEQATCRCYLFQPDTSWNFFLKAIGSAIPSNNSLVPPVPMTMIDPAPRIRSRIP